MRDVRRRWLVAGLVALVPLALLLVGGHRGNHAARSLLVPGAGLLEAAPLAGVAFALLAVAATVAWLRWGTDWIVAGVVVAAMMASAWWGSVDHAGAAADAWPAPALAAHEFPLVVLIIGFLAWLRSALGSVPGFGWVRGRRSRPDQRRDLADLPPVERCRAASILALAGRADDEVRAAIARPDVAARARRIGLAARFRTGGDPFRRDHAHARTAALLTDSAGPHVRDRFRADAHPDAGVPASEPGFVRLLDGTLAAIALDQPAWARMLRGPFGVRRGHRPAWWWTPLGLPAGRAVDWEHAAATALAHERGWIDASDWPLLRRRVLGAAARGVARRDDERLIAAGRIWLALVDDPAAARVVERPTVRHDPLARALDTYATVLATRSSTTVPTSIGAA